MDVNLDIEMCDLGFKFDVAFATAEGADFVFAAYGHMDRLFCVAEETVEDFGEGVLFGDEAGGGGLAGAGVGPEFEGWHGGGVVVVLLKKEEERRRGVGGD